MMARRITVLLYLLFLALTCVSSPTQAADAKPDATKAYSPFDEPRPKISQEIIDDKRLDMKVKVFCKSKNMKQLFSDLSEKTGVKITVNRKLWGERPIIYFHNRPLRDVMTEISGLYGYHWLISGKPGAYKYEMFEDVLHKKRRSDVEQQQKDEHIALLNDFTEKAIADPKSIDEAISRASSSPETRLPSQTSVGLPSVVAAMDPEWLNDATKGIIQEPVSFGELPDNLQNALLGWMQAFHKGLKEYHAAEGRNIAEKTYTLSDLQDTKLHVMGGFDDGIEIPSVFFTLADETLKTGALSTWPPPILDEDDIRKVVNAPMREKICQNSPLPEKCSITANQERPAEYDCSYVMLGDILKGVAEQGKIDVIADYYLQDYSALQAMEKYELKKALEDIFDILQYSSRYDGSTLELRDNSWFIRIPAVEPPSSLIDKCWRQIADKGALDIETLIEIASLPDEPREWNGFNFIPHASRVFLCAESLRLWHALGPQLVADAMSAEGLPVSQLDDNQFAVLFDWSQSAEIEDHTPSDPEVLRKGILRITYKTQTEDEGGNEYNVSVKLEDPKSKLSTLPISMCSEFDNKQIKTILAQLKADLAADVIEVLPQTSAHPGK